MAQQDNQREPDKYYRYLGGDGKIHQIEIKNDSQDNYDVKDKISDKHNRDRKDDEYKFTI